MTDTTTSGAGGGAAPGWYADPHDPAQLRWWSGEAWTEHVSPAAPPVAPEQPTPQGTAAPEAAVPEAAAPEPAAPETPAPQPVAAQAVASPQPIAEVASVPEAASEAPAYQAPAAEPAAPFIPAVSSALEPLPSRRALREAGGAPIVATPAPQTAVPPTAWNEPAQPVQSTEPVQSTDPLQSTEPDQSEAPAQSETPVQSETPAQTAEPVQPPVSAQPHETPQQAVPAQVVPDQNAWNQPVQAPQAETYPPPSVLPPQPVQPVQAADQNAWNQPSQSAPATAWSLPPMVPSAQSAPELPPVVGAPLIGEPGVGAPVEVAPSRRRTPATVAESTSLSTIWVYLVAITPILAAAAAIYVISANSYDLTGWMLPVALVAPYLLGILFAVADRSKLLTLGFEQPAPWFWAALTAPVYLIQRAGEARRETGKGGPALVVWFVCFLLAIAAIFGWGLLAHHPLFPGLPS